MLIETFVERLRYTGAVYRASGWVNIGTTQGRGPYDTKNRYDRPKKDIWLRPLRKDRKRILKPLESAGIRHRESIRSRRGTDRPESEVDAWSRPVCCYRGHFLPPPFRFSTV